MTRNAGVKELKCHKQLKGLVVKESYNDNFLSHLPEFGKLSFTPLNMSHTELSTLIIIVSDYQAI